MTRLGIAAAAAAVIALSIATPLPAAATDYPTWSDVQGARNDQAATQALVDRLNAALDDAQARSAALSDTALTAAATATQARVDADAATTRAQQLGAESAAADARLATAKETLGALASGRYREESSTPLLARLLTDADPSTILDRLGLLDRLNATWREISGAAVADANTAASLRAQAQTAEAERVRLADAADTASRDAQAAVAAEGAQVSSLRGQVDTMYAQLATLKDTTARVERQYRIGQEVAAEPPPSPPPSVGSGSGSGGSGSGSGGSGSGGGSGDPGDSGGGYGVVVDPAGARAYARSAIGAYGWGDDQYQCLVLLWNRESGWRADALNPWSGAYGIPQALPGSKMASAGADWRTNGATQVDWGLSYIDRSYGTPCSAWDHSERTNWY
ncbi:hypothetical protein ABCS02_08915 [Microbacterium sp. X-17]|uniref:aggregation-promoting factor C-terminal-like domain-containing protein n=1 Tax=Microbacterium sp. X-17 TaxID=3144404 RepID=UPI0031F47BD9